MHIRCRVLSFYIIAIAGRHHGFASNVEALEVLRQTPLVLVVLDLAAYMIFFAVQLASLALCYVYFAAPQAVFSGLVAGCLGRAIWQLRQFQYRQY